MGRLARRAVRRLRRLARRLLRERQVDEVALVHGLLRGGPPGRVLVDVGAHHGGALEPFALDGWVVHAFEPDPENRSELERRWDGWPGVRIDARAVSDREADAAPFYRSRISTGISALAPFHASHEPAAPVAVTTLSAYFEERGVGRVDFLKVDAEGHDLSVLKGVPWDRVQPGVVVCEFDEAKASALGYGYRELAGFLVDHGYHLLVSEWYPIVQYGAAHRWRRFAAYPAPLEDPAAWGNLIGLRDRQAFDRLARQAGALRP